MFTRGSRYEKVPEAIHTDPAGREIPYKRLRLIPAATGLQTHRVAPDDRLDLIAFRYYRDPEQFWRICDANAALHPEELTAEVGRRLHVPLPEG